MKLALATALSLVAVSASAAPLPRYGAFVFSSLCTEAQSGDVGGSRIVLVRTPGQDELTFSYGSGGLSQATVDSLKIDGDHLSADLTAEGGKATLGATLSADAARVQFNLAGTTTTQKLNRVTDFSRKRPVCH